MYGIIRTPRYAGVVAWVERSGSRGWGNVKSGFPHIALPLHAGDVLRPNIVQVVGGDRWDTFFRFPPCGTVAEIESTLAAAPDKQDMELLVKLMKETEDGGKRNAGDRSETMRQDATPTGKTGEIAAVDTRTLGCVQCHMPLVKRPLVEGGVEHDTRRHLWRGGHDPEMVKKALTIDFAEVQPAEKGTRRFRLMLANTGAAHYVPTGTPDRHLTVHLRLLNEQEDVLDEQTHTIKRTVMWRPFIVDLWDTRLCRWQARQYELEVSADSGAVHVEAEIRYHLLAEGCRQRLGYENKTPIEYEVFRKRLVLKTGPPRADNKGANSE